MKKSPHMGNTTLQKPLNIQRKPLFQFAIVFILLASCLPRKVKYTEREESPSFLDLTRRSHRLLASGSFGGYSIEYPSSDIDCNLLRGDMEYSQADLDRRNYYTTRMFKFGRGTSLKWLKALTDSKKGSMKTVVFWALFPVFLVGILLGILIGLVALADVILRLIGKEGLLFKGGDGEDIKTESLRKIVFMVLAALTVIIIVLMFFWLMYGIRAKSSYNKAQCANKYLYEDLVYGINDESMSFAGTKGLRYLLGNLKEEFKVVKYSSIDSEDIVNLTLNTKEASVSTALITYSSEYGSHFTSSCSGNDRLVQPDSVKTLQPYINDDISKESQILMRIASDIHIGAETIYYLQNRGCLKKYTLSLDMMLGKVGEFERAIESSDYQTRLKKITDYPYSRTKMMWFIWLCFIFLTIGLIFTLLVLFTNVFQGNNKEMARLCQGIGAIILFILGVWYSILAIRAANRAHR